MEAAEKSSFRNGDSGRRPSVSVRVERRLYKLLMRGLQHSPKLQVLKPEACASCLQDNLRRLILQAMSRNAVSRP